MERRPLGRTGLRVSRIGLGTVKLGRNTGVRYPASFELPSDPQVEALLTAALALGVNLIDTAPAYGSSERRLRGFVQRHRDALVLGTKAGERYEAGRSRFDFSAQAIVASAQASLRDLGVDAVDLLLLHSDGRDLEILTQTDAMEGLRRLKQSGLARAVGISAKTDAGIRQACDALDVVMAPFHRADRALGEALAAAHAAGLGVLAIKGLGSGHLAAGTDPAKEAAAAVAFVLNNPFIDALIVGTLDAEHLAQAVAAIPPSPGDAA